MDCRNKLSGGKIPVLSTVTGESIRIKSNSEQSGEITDEVIAHSAKPHFVFQLVMSKNLPTYCIQPRIYDLGMLHSLFIDFDLGNSFWKAGNKFFSIVINDWRENLDCRQQPV